MAKDIHGNVSFLTVASQGFFIAFINQGKDLCCSYVVLIEKAIFYYYCVNSESFQTQNYYKSKHNNFE